MTKKKSCNVTAVVVSHDRPDELPLVISALQTQSSPPRNILVIDNASHVPVEKILSNFTDIEIIRNKENTGGAGGFSHALEVALNSGSEWIWAMDDDAIPYPDALETLLSYESSVPINTGALFSAVYELGSLATMHRRTFSKSFGIERQINKKKYNCKFCEIDTGSFVGFLVKASAARDIDLPDKSFFLSYDDIDYSLRMKKKGWSLWLIPESKILHLRSHNSRLKSSPFGSKHYYNIRNRIHVAKKYTTYKKVAVAIAILTGITIWATSKKHSYPQSFSLFKKAVCDGLHSGMGRLI